MQDRGETPRKGFVPESESPAQSQAQTKPKTKAAVPPPAPKPDKKVSTFNTTIGSSPQKSESVPVNKPATFNVTVDVGGKKENLDFGIPAPVQSFPAPPPPSDKSADFPAPPPPSSKSADFPAPSPPSNESASFPAPPPPTNNESTKEFPAPPPPVNQSPAQTTEAPPAIPSLPEEFSKKTEISSNTASAPAVQVGKNIKFVSNRLLLQ